MKAQIVTYLKAGLKDIRCSYAALSLEEVMFRNSETEDNKYRLYTETPSQDPDEEPVRTYIKTVDELLLNISEDELKVYPQPNRKGSGHNTGTIVVLLTNVRIRLNSRFPEDIGFIRDMMNPNTLGFTMGYCNDLDETLPLKPLSVVYRTL